MKHARTAPRHAKPATAKHARRRRTSPIALIVGLALCLCGAALLGYVGVSQHKATAVEPTPNAVIAYDKDGFPQVDWDYWRKTNIDVIGWLTIPGTSVNLPICQAPASDPQFYLTHDVYGSYNVYGCLYLDAECASKGFDSPVSLVFGHHMDDGTMLSPIAGYSGQAFLDEHPTILLQTSDSKKILDVAAVKVVNANVEEKAVSFATESSFKLWWSKTLEEANLTKGEGIQRASRVVELCTCSYGLFPSNERTLVFAVEG